MALMEFTLCTHYRGQNTTHETKVIVSSKFPLGSIGGEVLCLPTYSLAATDWGLLVGSMGCDSLQWWPYSRSPQPLGSQHLQVEVVLAHHSLIHSLQD